MCRKHAWNARSKQRHVPDAKQVLLWKGWVRKQRLNDVQSRVGATATRARVESPPRTELFVDSWSEKHQGNCCASTREIPATWISIRTQGTERCSCDETAAVARHKHTWISLRAQRHMFRRKDCCVLTLRAQLDLSPRANRNMFMRQHCCDLTPGAHLDLSPCASKKTCSCDRLLRSHAGSTLGSPSVRKVRYVPAKRLLTAAFSRRQHSWISLRGQRNRFHRKDCSDLALPPKLDDFYGRTPDPVSTVKRAHVPYAIGNP